MKVPPGDLIVGLMMICFLPLGVILAGKGLDAEMKLFGAGLAIFAGLFLIGQVRRLRAVSHIDAMERPRG